MTTINDADFQQLVRFMGERYGINLAHKRQLIDARLSFDLQRRGYRDFSDYVADVIANPYGEECRHMVNKLSTNYTFFFREADYIDQLDGVVLPDFLLRGIRRMQVWSAACSSGQEAYSLAMVLSLLRERRGGTFDFHITGTDINTDMLALAGAGSYEKDDYAHIPPCYHRFLTHHGDDSFQVSEAVRQCISWQYGNLMDAAYSPGRYDLIFCRNVMIYFTPQLRRDITVKLYGALRPGGYLFTGTTESIDLERKYFRYLAPAFYQKRA